MVIFLKFSYFLDIFALFQEKSNKQSDRVNGWYPISSPGQRQETKSPLSWKDILENSYHLEDYSEYAKVPKGNGGILPSRKHRKVAVAEVCF